MFCEWRKQEINKTPRKLAFATSKYSLGLQKYNLASSELLFKSFLHLLSFILLCFITIE